MKYVRRTSYDIKDNFIPNLLKDRGIINEDNEEMYFYPTEEVELNSCQPVSYTHLTLPTILRV